MAEIESKEPVFMAEECKIVDIWVGAFINEAALSDYLAETYSEDDSVAISRLAADMGEQFYDHDFVESSFNELSTSDVACRLKPHSFSSSYTASAVRAFEAALSPAFNTVLLVWGNQFRKPVSVRREKYWLHYLGSFDCDPRT